MVNALTGRRVAVLAGVTRVVVGGAAALVPSALARPRAGDAAGASAMRAMTRFMAIRD
jgi:hypothetical protein